jgi:hypothetical protein
MHRGTIIANRAARRVIRLDDGREVSFDLDVCAFDHPPHVDQVAWVELDPAGARATRLTTIDPDASPPPARSLSQDVATLQGAGIARELDDNLLHGILEDLGLDEDRADVVSVLAEFYVLHPAAAARDGWISCDWKEPLNELVDQINRGAGRRLLEVVDVEVRETTERGHKERRSRVTFGTAGGNVTCDVDSLNDVIALASKLLERSGDRRLFVDLTEDDNVTAIRLSPAQVEQLSAILRRP